MMQTRLIGCTKILGVLFTVIVFMTMPAIGSSSTRETAELSFEEALNTLPRLRSLLISIDGELVDERYFHGARSTHRANLKSASKSIISTLIGIALDRGQLKSIRDPIAKFFPEHLGAKAEAAKNRITIEDLLTMRSGLETTSNVNYGRWVTSANWVGHVLTRPLIEEPGGRMIYSTGNSHLLSALLTKATKMSTFEFARRYLAEPLGIAIHPWTRDPQGIYLGGNDMHLTPRAMLKYGELYLNRGRMHEKQIVSAHWVEESLKARTRSSWSGRDYGFGWWIDNLGGQTIHYAWGHGGQFIVTVPRLRLVVVTTAVPAPDDGRREHQRAIYDLMERHLIPTAEKSCSHLAEPSRVSTELTDRTVLRQTCRSGLIPDT
jgi:CubicO group peptidase (beta-lactamase class C family)